MVLDHLLLPYSRHNKAKVVAESIVRALRNIPVADVHTVGVKLRSTQIAKQFICYKLLLCKS